MESSFPIMYDPHCVLTFQSFASGRLRPVIYVNVASFTTNSRSLLFQTLAPQIKPFEINDFSLGRGGGGGRGRGAWFSSLTSLLAYPGFSSVEA